MGWSHGQAAATLDADAGRVASQVGCALEAVFEALAATSRPSPPPVPTRPPCSPGWPRRAGAPRARTSPPCVPDCITG